MRALPRRILLVLTIVCLALVTLRASAAVTLAYQTTSVSLTYSFSGTLGYEFTPQQDIIVKELGYFDFGQNGLTNLPPIGWPLVGLYQLDGTLIVQSAVTSSDRLDGLYRFATIPDTLLTGGIKYVIGGRTEADPVTDTRFSTISVSPLITLGNARFHPSSNLNFPNNSAPGFIYNDPNFTFNVAPVPEPAMLLILPAFALAAPYVVRRLKAIENA
jgi:hypothetical protein